MRFANLVSDNFFAVVGTLLQFPAVIIATAFALWRTLVDVINFSAHFAGSPSGDTPQKKRGIDHHVHNQRRLKAVLLEQFAEPLRLGHGSRKSIEHEAMRTIRAFDAMRDHAKHNRIRHQLAAAHNRLRALPQRSALRYMLAKHVAGGKMRRGKPARQLFGLSPFPGPRRSEKNYRTVQLVIRATVRRHSVVSPPSYRVQVTGLPVTGAYRRPRNRPFRANPS